MNALLKGFVLLAASLTGFQVMAQAASPATSFPTPLKVAPLLNTAGQPVALTVTGTWNSSCTPQADTLKIETQGVVLVATSEKSKSCLTTPTAIELTFNFADEAAADLGPGVHPVSLYIREQGQQAARLAGFDLVALGTQSSFAPEAGLWWSESGGEFETSGPGVGFALEIQGDEAVLMTNSYDDTGQSRWLLTTGSLDGSIIRGDLTELGGGQKLFGEFRHPDRAQHWGRALLEFHSSSRATLWLVGQQPSQPSDLTTERLVDLLVQPMSLVRFSISPQDMFSGTWMLLPEDGGQATRLELTEVESGRNTMTLLDSSGTTVTCRRLDRRRLSPPQICRLRGVEDIRFDDIGLNRWRGEDASGLRYIAVRLDP